MIYDLFRYFSEHMIGQIRIRIRNIIWIRILIYVDLYKNLKETKDQAEQ